MQLHFNRNLIFIKVRKILSFLFLIVTLTGFSQSVPVASDVSTSFYYAPDAEGVIHLVGTDGDYQNLTYTIVTLPSHGKLFDGSTEITAPGAISGSKVTFKQFNADTDSTAYNETLEPNFIFDGTINFTYNVNDGTTNSSNATVTIKIFDNWHSNATDHQLGADIDGSIAADFLGFSVALNEDGTIMAVGEPKFDPTGKNEGGGVRVFSFDGSGWVSYGNRIEGENIGEQFGSSVSLSGDGSILAAGAPLYDSQKGRVQVYQKAGSSWNKYGTDISSDVNSVQFGQHVKLSSDGSTVAISDIWWGAGGSKVGQVIVYRINGSGVWLPMGDAQSGGQTDENLSWSMDLSSDGNILAVGSQDYDGAAGNNQGKVTVYKYDNTNDKWDLWTTILDPYAYANDRFGWALDMNSDGSRIAIGAYGDDGADKGTTKFMGSANMFSIDITSASPTAAVAYPPEAEGADPPLKKYKILGEAGGDRSGFWVSLDNEGNSVAIAAPRNDGGGSLLFTFRGRSSPETMLQV